MQDQFNDPDEPPTFWNASRTIGLGMACLAAFLVMIYFISP
jgi:hypothetical protein